MQNRDLIQPAGAPQPMMYQMVCVPQPVTYIAYIPGAPAPVVMQSPYSYMIPTQQPYMMHQPYTYIMQPPYIPQAFSAATPIGETLSVAAMPEPQAPSAPPAEPMQDETVSRTSEPAAAAAAIASVAEAERPAYREPISMQDEETARPPSVAANPPKESEEKKRENISGRKSPNTKKNFTVSIENPNPKIIFLYNPNNPNNAEEFKRLFGITFMEDDCKDYEFDIREVNKLKQAGIPHPYGVFTRKSIPAGTILFEYKGEHRSVREHGEPRSLSYVCRAKDQKGSTEDQYIDAEEKGNIARFVNHFNNPNCEYYLRSDGRVFVKTLRPISPNEQLGCSYGLDYWQALRIQEQIVLTYLHDERTWDEFYQDNKKVYFVLSDISRNTPKHIVDYLKKMTKCDDEKQIYLPVRNFSLPVLVKNANGNFVTVDDMTLFHLDYMLDNHSLTAQKVENFSGDINFETANGQTQLHFLVNNDSMDEATKIGFFIQLEINCEINFYIVDKWQKSILHYCIEKKYHQILAELLKSTLDWDGFERCPVLFAMQCDNPIAFKMLLEKGMQVDLYLHKIRSQLITALAKLVPEKQQEYIQLLASFMQVPAVTRLIAAVNDVKKMKPRRRKTAKGSEDGGIKKQKTEAGSLVTSNGIFRPSAVRPEKSQAPDPSQPKPP